MDGTTRIQGMILAVALPFAAGGMTASAHSDGTTIEVPGESGPVGPETLLDPNHGLSPLKLGPSDIADALHIALPAEPAPQHASQPGGPLQVAYHRGMPEQYLDHLTLKMGWIPLDDGTIASPVSVTSPGATNMRMGLLVDLPPGGEIRFFGADRQQLYPLITREDIDWKGATPLLRWSPVVEGDTIGAEIVLPSKEALPSLTFAIDRISHGYGPDGGFGYRPALQCSNHVDVACRVGRFPRNKESSVARIRFDNVGGGFGGLCSGVLLNDKASGSQVPYFMTAHHCVSHPAEASSITTRWFYKRATCGSNRLYPYVTTNYGADLLATSSRQDSTLLRFRRLLPRSYPFYYSGWTTADAVNGTAVYGLHHPSSEEMKYSAGTKTGGTRIRLRNTNIIVEPAMVVDWSEGTTEPGSSGSPLFAPGFGHRLVGVLSAGDDGCHANDYYGFFPDFFPHARRWLNDATTAPVVPPPYPDDHGNTFLTGTDVGRLPSTTAGNLDYAGDEDWFLVDVPWRGRLRAYTTGGTDTYGTLTGPNGSRIVADGDDGDWRNFDLTADVPSGYYLIEVRGQYSERVGRYSLTVELSGPDDHGDFRGNATLVPIPSTTEGILDYGGDEDYFRIDVGGTARIVASTTGSTDTYGTLFRGETRVAENDDGGDGTNFTFTADVQAGAHYIAVRGNSRNIVGPYSLRVRYASFVHTLPFVTPAGNRTQRSLVRIINNSDRAGRVTIHAIDDTGRHFGPAAMWHKARQARHFDSRRLEDGTGMIGQRGVGDGEGNWRLEVSSSLDITPLAYLRGTSGASGLETTMHDVVRTVANRQHVVNFHEAPDDPGTASSYSLLRIVNPNDGSAGVTISGRDDLGVAAAGGEVSLALPAGAARMLTSTELENGGDGLEGSLGSEGTGRWRLTVSADRPVWVMSLMSSPSAGYITNVSSVRMEP